MSLAAKSIDNLINLNLESCLIEEGYRKSGRNYFCYSDISIKVVNIQLSRWNFNEFGMFTVNLGVYFPSVEILFEGKTIKKPKEYECTISTRIGHLLPENNDKWWPIDDKTSIDKTVNEIKNVWIQYGKSWIDKNSNLLNAKQYCIDKHLYVKAAAICLALGQNEEAKEAMKRALETDKSPEGQKFYLEYANKLKIHIP